MDEWVAQAGRTRARWFADQLRSCPSGDAAVPGLEWTVTDLGRHLTALPRFWDSQNAAGPNLPRPDDFAKVFDSIGRDVEESDPSKLADLVVANFDDYLARLAESDQRWIWSIPTTPDKMGGMALNELILHGGDLAGVTGAKKPTYERREANLAADAAMVTAGYFVDSTKAKALPDGVYHVHFRGGNDYTWTKTGGELIVSDGKPRSPDAHLSADPAAFMMVSFGRMSSLRATLTGAMIAYGRKPWRFAKLGDITVDGF